MEDLLSGDAVRIEGKLVEHLKVVLENFVSKHGHKCKLIGYGKLTHVDIIHFLETNGYEIREEGFLYANELWLVINPPLILE